MSEAIKDDVCDMSCKAMTCHVMSCHGKIVASAMVATIHVIKH